MAAKTNKGKAMENQNGKFAIVKNGDLSKNKKLVNY